MSPEPSPSFQTASPASRELHLTAALLVFIFLFTVIFPAGTLIFLGKSPHYTDGLPLANRFWHWEPRVFSRLRWALKSREILDFAYSKYHGEPFRLERGDTKLVVFPTDYIPELNKLPAELLNSREYHSFSMVGHLTGLDVVLKTNHHVKMLLSRVSPALLIPEMLIPTTNRINSAVSRLFPQEDSETWTTIKPLNLLVHCVSEGVALALFGSPTCDNPELIRLCFEHTRDVFTVVFAMRFVPFFLQPILVWLVPAKWRANRGWKALERFVIPEVNRRRRQMGLEDKRHLLVADNGSELGDPSIPSSSPADNAATQNDLISWMVKDGRSAVDTDPSTLARLVGSVAAGGTYSTANFVCRVVSDLTAHPDILAAVRQEIYAMDAEVGGRENWNFATYGRLEKLESAMKETSRLAPGSLLVYSRVLQGSATISLPGTPDHDGTNIPLKQGQFITVSSHNRSMDPRVFPDPHTYHGLRFYQNANDQAAEKRPRPRPFHSLDGDILTWGAGRWACPGRFIATITAKILLVKILDEYEFEFYRGKEPPSTVIHEFGFWHPDEKMRVRRRRPGAA